MCLCLLLHLTTQVQIWLLLALLDSSSDDSSVGKSCSDTSDDEEGVYEVDEIMRHRRS